MQRTKELAQTGLLQFYSLYVLLTTANPDQSDLTTLDCIFSQPMQNNEIPMPNPNSQNNMFPMHPIQHAGSQAPFSSMYNIPQPHPPITPDSNLMDAWYYEDPEVIAFSSEVEITSEQVRRGVLYFFFFTESDPGTFLFKRDVQLV